MEDDSWGLQKRNRKQVERYKAGPASYRAPGDFAKPDKVDTPVKRAGNKRGRKRSSDAVPLDVQPTDTEVEALKCPPEDMIDKKVKVFWEDVGKWFYGIVESYTPSLKHLAFSIVYDDEDEEDGTLCKTVFINEEGIRRPYEVVAGGPKPAIVQETTAVPEPAHEPELPAQPSKPVQAQMRAPAPKSAATQPSAAAHKPAAVQAPVSLSAAAHKPAATQHHVGLPMAAPKPATLPTPISLPGRKAATAAVPELTPSANILSKFEQQLQKHTSAGAKSMAAPPSTPDQPGNLTTSAPNPRSVVMGVPAPGQTSAAAPVGPGSSLGPSPLVRKPPTLTESIPDWSVQQATPPASRQPQRPPVTAPPAPAATSALAREASLPAAASFQQPIRNDEPGSATAPSSHQPALPHSPDRAQQPAWAQQSAGAAEQPAAALVEAPSWNLPADTTAASPAHAAEKEAAVSAAAAEVSAAAAVGATTAESPAKRKRGRPPKVQTGDAKQSPTPLKKREQSPGPPKKRGRPRKADAERMQQQNGAVVDTIAEAASEDQAQHMETQPADGPSTSKPAVTKPATQDSKVSKNGYRPLGADADALPAPRPESQQQVGAGEMPLEQEPIRQQQGSPGDRVQKQEPVKEQPDGPAEKAHEQEPVKQQQDVAAERPRSQDPVKEQQDGAGERPRAQEEKQQKDVAGEGPIVQEPVNDQQNSLTDRPHEHEAAKQQEDVAGERLSAESPLKEQQGGAGERPRAQKPVQAATTWPAVMNSSGTCSPAEMQQRLMSGGHASTSSPAVAFDARAAAQPPRRGGKTLVNRAASTSAPSKLGTRSARPTALSPATSASPSPVLTPRSHLDQREPGADESNPWFDSPVIAGGREDQRQQAAANDVAVVSSPSLPPAKAAGHAQVTKLITMLPSRLSPAYTPSLKPPSRTPVRSAKRSSFGVDRDPMLASPASLQDSPALKRNGDDGAEHAGTPKQEQSKEELEAVRRRKGQDSIMRKVEHAVKVLTRNKDSIKAATVLANQAAHRGAAPRVIRYLIERIDKEAAGPKRVDILYLTDSVLQTCRNPKWPSCGPDSAPAQAYPRVIAAALPALIKAVSEDSEGAKKADKVLNLWAKRDMLPAASLQPEINRLKERLHEHDSAATAKAAARSLQKQASDAAKNNGSTAIRIGAEGGGEALMELKQEEDDDWDDDEAAPLPALPQAKEEEEEHRPPWQRTGGTDVAVGAAPGSPEGSPWHQGVSPASSNYAPWSPSLSPKGGQTTPQHVPAALAAPWQPPVAAPVRQYASAPARPLRHSGYAAAAAPAPRPPPPLQAWPPAQPLPPQPQLLPVQPQPPLQPLPPLSSNSSAAPQQITWEPEEAWDSDSNAAEVVPPGLADAPQVSAGAKDRKPWRPSSLERVSSPGLYAQNKGNAPGPSRLAATEPAQLLDEFDNIYNGSTQQQPSQPGGVVQAPARAQPPVSFPALFPLPPAPTPPSQGFAPPQYAAADEEPPPLPADEPPPLPPPEDEDDDNFVPPLPAGPPPPTPPHNGAAQQQNTIMEVEMQDAGPVLYSSAPVPLQGLQLQ